MQMLLTKLLLLLACALTLAWPCLWLRERGIRPVRDVLAFFRRRSWFGRVLFGTYFVAVCIYGGMKPGGGTNNVPQMLPPGGGGMEALPNHGSGILGNLAIPQFSNPAIQGPCDFSTPSNAVVCSDWLAFGGFEDWTCDCAIVKMWKCAITELPIVVESGNSHWMIPLLHNGIIAQSPIVGRRAIRVGISHGAGNC